MALRSTDILTQTPQGLYCPLGDFHIDPVRPVKRALITHGHSDHARSGHRSVLATRETLLIMGVRYGEDFAGSTQEAPLGESIRLKDVTCLFAPPQAGENFLIASAPINVVATPRAQSAIHATVRASLVSADRDAQIEVFAWDAQGQSAGGEPFYWRCTVALEEGVG